MNLAKRWSYKVLALALVSILCFSVIGCKDKDTTNNGGSNEIPTGKYIVTEQNTSQYSI